MLPCRPSLPPGLTVSFSHALAEWLEKGLLQRLVLVVNSAVGQKEVLERWTFQVETDKAVLEGG